MHLGTIQPAEEMLVIHDELELFCPQDNLLAGALCRDNIMEEELIHRWDRISNILQAHLNNAADA